MCFLLVLIGSLDCLCPMSRSITQFSFRLWHHLGFRLLFEATLLRCFVGFVSQLMLWYSLGMTIGTRGDCTTHLYKKSTFMMSACSYVFLILDIDECADKPCQNGGNCTEGVNNYNCSCVPGYTGINCSIGKE